ncbi:unnamed protein product [Darwinula stevensoni]|uniref:FACT complex subunit SSRP1 n=1 Tax=Darwinula stevensoni TaxID=69355 RepID=A0A7R9AC33_9CRUS|nr:unnamed protein product [Darwinula stevensoni]CAG0899999.1 unnamed protein product [Darwinula stevensoni]
MANPIKKEDMKFLEYPNSAQEIMGAMVEGKLKMTDQAIIFKNGKTGKVDHITMNEIDLLNWQRLAGNWGLRVFLKNGHLHRFGGFKETDKDHLAQFFRNYYNKELADRELSVKGWNWGTARFKGGVMSFDVSSATAFEIPLPNVSQCMTGKNEVTLEFHQNDEAPVSLMEMRFHIPSSELAGDTDPVDAFKDQVMKQASVITATGDAIATFKEVQCLLPRGRYDIKLYQTSIQLHGKAYDYKISTNSVLRLFLLPNKDQMFYVVSLDPPIKQGQTRYHFLILQFPQDSEKTIEIPLSEEELKNKYDGKLEKEMSGPTYEVLAKVMKVLVNRKVTVPGAFSGVSGMPCVTCSYKASAGLLYPLERGFLYIHKPPIHIRFEEIGTLNFARSGGSTRSFDIEIETKSSVIHTFSSIGKEEYGKLYDFISSKKLRIKNRGRLDAAAYTDDLVNSDAESEPDAYLARMKAEADEESDEGEGDDESEEDEDFAPEDEKAASDVAEEYDSNPESNSSNDDSEGGGSDGEKKKKRKKEKKKTVSEKPRKRRKKGGEKDETKPKRPMSAYFRWLNASRDRIKEENPGISITELTKKAGELWREMSASDKKPYEEKAEEGKKEYEKAMKEWKASGGGKDKGKSSPSTPVKAGKAKSKVVESPTKAGSGSGFKSKEYISSSEDTSSEDDSPTTKTSASAKDVASSKGKKDKDDSEDEEEEAESTPDTSEESDADSD